MLKISQLREEAKTNNQQQQVSFPPFRRFLLPYLEITHHQHLTNNTNERCVV